MSWKLVLVARALHAALLLFFEIPHYTHNNKTVDYYNSHLRQGGDRLFTGVLAILRSVLCLPTNPSPETLIDPDCFRVAITSLIGW